MAATRKRPSTPAEVSASHAAQFRDLIIEDWLVNALDCLVCGDALGDREIIRRALLRVAMSALMAEANKEHRVRPSAEDAERQKP